MPGREALENIYELGCSTDWLLYGDGKMYAKNETGARLSEEHGFNKEEKTNSETERMIKEIYENMKKRE